MVGAGFLTMYTDVSMFSVGSDGLFEECPNYIISLLVMTIKINQACYKSEYFLKWGLNMFILQRESS